MIVFLQQIWGSVLNHVAGVHEWGDLRGDGQCLHGNTAPVSEINASKSIISKSSVTWNLLRDVVLDPQLQKDMKYYADFL